MLYLRPCQAVSKTVEICLKEFRKKRWRDEEAIGVATAEGLTEVKMLRSSSASGAGPLSRGRLRRA